MLGKPILLTQADFDNMVRDAKLSKNAIELIVLRLKSQNLCTADFRITEGRKRALTQEFDDKFITDSKTKITYCWNIEGLFEHFNFKHVTADRRLLIDGSTESLKVVLLNIKNKHPSVPFAYARGVAESYENMEVILDLIQYQTYKWLICCDLKVICFLTGLKKRYPTNQCFLCL